MKNYILAFTIAASGHFALAHGDPSRVSIEPELQGSYTAGDIEYDFQLVDTKSNTLIKESDLLVNQTKKLHMIAYDPSLNEFTHVHPEFDGQIWKVKMTLNVNGDYFLWAQGELLDKEEFSALLRMQVVNGQAEITPVSMGDVRKVTVGQTTITLTNTKLKAGKAAMLNFKVTREDGQAPAMAPYLGELAHIISTPTDGDQLIHAHAMAMGSNAGMVHVTFPDAGEYRLWIQFIEHGELKIMPLSVVVLK